MDDEQIKKLNEELEKLGKSIDAKLETHSKDVSEATTKEIKSATLKEAKAAIEPMIKEYNDKTDLMQKHIDGLDVTIQKMTTKETNKPVAFKDGIQTLLEKIQEDNEGKSLRNWFDTKGKNLGEIEFKVDDMTQTLNLGAGVIPGQSVPGIVFDPDRADRIRDLITPGTTNSNTVEFVYESAFDDNTDITAEGAEYKQGDFDLALSTATVRKITAYQIVSEEMLDDVAGLTSYISSRLPSKLKLKEDYQLMYGDNTGTNLNGLTTGATAYVDALADADITEIDVLVDAARQVRVEEYRATAMLIHPTDATKIKLTKDDNGNYIHPWIFMPGGSITLDGVPVIVTTAITAGDFLVGDFKLGAQVFDRKQMTLEFTDKNEDNFIKGMVTVKISERITLAVYRSNAMIYGTFTAALANGSA